ncbi:hypothetical protein Q4R10_19690 [Morganella morganii]
MKVIGYWILGVCSLFIFISLIMWIGVKDEYDFARSFSTIITLSSIGSFGLVVGSILAGCGAIVCEIRLLRDAGAEKPKEDNISSELGGNFNTNEEFSFKKWTASSFVVRSDSGLKFNESAVTAFVADMRSSRPDLQPSQLSEHYKNGIDSIRKGLPESLRNAFTEDFFKKISE